MGNVIIAPPVSVKYTKQANLASEDGSLQPCPLSPEVYILPRQPQSNFEEGVGFSGSVLAMAGLILAKTEEAYDAFTEESLKGIFSKSVAIKGSAFDDLICKAAWLAA